MVVPRTSRANQMKFRELPADAWARPGRSSGGYKHHSLREDVADDYLDALDELHEAGALLTSSGSRRRLTANVGRARSATSLHYLGRAFDLFVGSGMVEPYQDDPFVVVPRGSGRWRVYARALGGDLRILPAWRWRKGRKPLVCNVVDRFVDFTGIMLRHGFDGIGRRSGWRTHRGCLEWWHFQHEVGLRRGVTTFGSELLKVYTREQLLDSPPWKYRAAVWNGGGFTR